MPNYDDYLEFEDYYISSAKFASISSAVELGIFEHLSSNPSGLEDICISLNLDKHVLDALLQALRSLRLIDKTNDLFHITEKSERFLLRKNRFYQGNEFLRKAHPEIHQRFISALRKGKASLEYSGQIISNMWHSGSINKEAARAFTHVMDSMMAFPANYHVRNSSISEHLTLIDIGGGSGAWALELCNVNSKIIVTVLDLPEVLETTKEILKDFSVSDRVKLLPGNFFDSLPSGDTYLLSNILHDWTETDCLKLLQKIHAYSEENCVLYINECLLNEDRISPTFTCLFNLLMAANHNSQQFTFNGLKELLGKAGFRFSAFESQIGYYQLMKFEKEKSI